MLWLQLSFKGKKVSRKEGHQLTPCCSNQQQKTLELEIDQKNQQQQQQIIQKICSHALDDLESTTSSCHSSEIGASSNFENLKSQIQLLKLEEKNNEVLQESEFEDDSNIWQFQQYQSSENLTQNLDQNLDSDSGQDLDLNSNLNQDFQQSSPVLEEKVLCVEIETNENQNDDLDSVQNFELLSQNQEQKQQQALSKQQRLEILNQETPLIQLNQQENLEIKQQKSEDQQKQRQNQENTKKSWFSWNHRRRKTTDLSRNSEPPTQQTTNILTQNSDLQKFNKNSEFSIFNQQKQQQIQQQQQQSQYKNFQKQSWSGFFLKPFSRIKGPADSSFFFACSQAPQELINFSDCEEFLLSMPGGAEGVGIIFQQLDKQLNSIQNDFDNFWGAKQKQKQKQNKNGGEQINDIQFEELLWNAQQRLLGLLLSGYACIVNHWPQNLNLSEDHSIAIQKSLQNIIFKKSQVQILENLGKFCKQEDEEIWKFCREMQQILPQNYLNVDYNQKWKPIYSQLDENQIDNKNLKLNNDCSQTESSFSRQESMVVEFDQKNSLFEQQFQIRFDWEVDSSSHDYFLGEFDVDVICMHTMVQFAVAETYDPFQLICDWLENIQIGPIYDDIFDQNNFDIDFISFPFKHFPTKSAFEEKQTENKNMGSKFGLSFDLNLSSSELCESLQLNNEILLTMQKDFDLSSEIFENQNSPNFQGALDHMLNMTCAECPIDIIFQISNCHRSIREVLAQEVGLGDGVGGQVPADEVLPVFINLVTHANFKHLATYVQYLEFSNLIGDHLTAQAQMVCNLQMAKTYIQMKIKEAVSQQNELNTIFYFQSVPGTEGQGQGQEQGQPDLQGQGQGQPYLQRQGWGADFVQDFLEQSVSGERIEYFRIRSNDHQLFDDSFDCCVNDSAMGVVHTENFVTRCSVQCQGEFEYGANLVPAVNCWQNQVQQQY